MRRRPGLRLRFALFFAALYLGGLAGIVAGLWIAHGRAGGPPEGYVLAGLVAGFALLGVTGWVAFLFDEHVARPIVALASDLETRARTGVGHEIDEGPARYLGPLAPSANAAAARILALREGQAGAVREETRQIGRDKAILETLLRDLAEGVVVLTPDRRVMLYNRAAHDLLPDLGLDRPLDNCLCTGPVDQALDRLAAAPGDDPARVEAFLCAASCGTRFLRGRAGAILAEGGVAGHVLIFQDATDDLAAHRAQEEFVQRLFEDTCRPATAISCALDLLATEAALPSRTRTALTEGARAEAATLRRRLGEARARQDAAPLPSWPMSEVPLSALLEALRGRVTAPVELSGCADEGRFIRCDAFALSALLAALLRRLREAGLGPRFTFGATPHGDRVRLELGWAGDDLPLERIEAWMDEPLSSAYGTWTGRDALALHRAEIWTERRDAGHCLVLPLPAAEAPRLRPTAERPEFYDFDLPRADMRTAADDMPLSKLTYVVFDTETTGLSPRGGDEIVQLAGVRIVNGRILRGEVFDRLVDPGRPIPAASTAVHGITDAMVKGAGDIAEVGRAFHGFCAGAVLVAHNAPFDLAFLRLKQDRIGRSFDHPVLCTVLLSAAMYGHTGEHTLDALARRFGVDLPDDVRHTALGDALATAQVFRQLLAVMAEADITTLGDAKEAARKMTHIRKKQSY